MPLPIGSTRRSTAIGLVLLSFGAAGCGRSQDRADATGVAERFFAAIDSGDGAAACAELSTDTRKSLEVDEKKPCREAIGSLAIESGALAKLELFLTNGKADLDNGESAFLSLTKEGWRLSAVGCKRGDGPPTDVPMDCELEA
jgi:hypothetical protein